MLKNYNQVISQLVKKYTLVFFLSLQFFLSYGEKSVDTIIIKIREHSSIQKLVNSNGYFNPKINAYYKFFYPSGTSMGKGLSIKGKRTGKWIYYFEEYKVYQEAMYKNGLREGKTITYYQNGEVESEIQYKAGLKINLCRGFYPNGILQYEHHYIRKKSVPLDPDAIVDSILNIKAEKPVVPNKKEYLNSDMETLNGPFKIWYEDGSVKAEGIYKKSIPEGEWKYYQKGGKISKTILYKNGELVVPPATKASMP